MNLFQPAPQRTKLDLAADFSREKPAPALCPYCGAGGAREEGFRTIGAPGPTGWVFLCSACEHTFSEATMLAERAARQAAGLRYEHGQGQPPKPKETPLAGGEAKKMHHTTRRKVEKARQTPGLFSH